MTEDWRTDPAWIRAFENCANSHIPAVEIYCGKIATTNSVPISDCDWAASIGYRSETKFRLWLGKLKDGRWMQMYAVSDGRYQYGCQYLSDDLLELASRLMNVNDGETLFGVRFGRRVMLPEEIVPILEQGPDSLPVARDWLLEHGWMPL